MWSQSWEGGVLNAFLLPTTVLLSLSHTLSVLNYLVFKKLSRKCDF